MQDTKISRMWRNGELKSYTELNSCSTDSNASLEASTCQDVLQRLSDTFLNIRHSSSITTVNAALKSDLRARWTAVPTHTKRFRLVCVHILATLLSSSQPSTCRAACVRKSAKTLCDHVQSMLENFAWYSKIMKAWQMVLSSIYVKRELCCSVCCTQVRQPGKSASFLSACTFGNTW